MLGSRFSRRSVRARAVLRQAAVAAILLPAAAARADTWDNSAGTNVWATATNWADNTTPTLADNVLLPSGLAATISMSSVTTATCANLTVSDNYRLLFVNPSTSKLQIGSGSGIISVGSGKTLTLDTALVDTQAALTINNGGLATMSVASVRTATTSIISGTLRLVNAASLGTGTVSVSGTGFLEFAGATFFVHPISLQNGGGLRAFGGEGDLKGPITVAGAASVKLNGGANASDVLKVGNTGTNAYTGGSGALTVVTGPGTVWMVLPSDYAGDWRVDGGTLRAGATDTLGSAATTVVVNNSGALQVGFPTFSRNVLLNSGGTLALADSATNVTGTTTVTSGASVNIEMRGNGSYHIADSANDLTGGGGLLPNISVIGTVAGGVLVLDTQSNYSGGWTLGTNATVDLALDDAFGPAANSVFVFNGAVLHPTISLSSAHSYVVNNGTISVDAGETFTLTGGLGAGGGALHKAGVGILSITANGSKSGTVELDTGTLIISAASALGTATLNVHAGVPIVNNVTIANNVSLDANEILRGVGTAGVSGNILLNSTVGATFDTAAGGQSLNLSGAISGGAGETINFSAPGSVTLSGSTVNTAPGLWQVTSGTLHLNKTIANGAISAGNVSIGTGAGSPVLKLDASEQIWNLANVNVFNGQFQLGGFTETVGSVSMSQAGSIIGGAGGKLILGGAAATGITVTGGTASTNITSNIDLGGIQRVFNISNGSVSNDAVIDGIISGSGGFVKNNSGSLYLTGASANTYTGGVTISAGQLTVLKNNPGIVALNGDVAVGDGSGIDTLQILQSEQIADSANLTIASTANVDLFGFTETINDLTMTGSGTITATGGGTLILNGALATNAAATTAVIQPNVALAGALHGFTIADGAAASDLTITGIVTDGTLDKSGAGKLTLGGVATSPQNLTINLSGGSLEMTTQRLVALNVGSGTSARITPSTTAAVTTAALSVAATGKFDISNNKLVVAVGGGGGIGSWTGSAYTGVTGLIAKGRNGGNWSGNGIVTSQSTATTGSLTSIGIATASQAKSIAVGATATWAGQTVTGSDTLVMYTYGGDATLDGKINVDDYGRIDSNANLPGVAGWYNGDFNYDGKINVDDYGIIDSNVPIQGPPFSTGFAAGNGLTAVPEPGCVSLLIAAAAAAGRGTIVGRRRRRR